jgi:hypothetical protein
MYLPAVGSAARNPDARRYTYRFPDSEPQPVPQVLKQPAYRLHKARHCAVVTLNGKNHYLGPWQSPESHEKYARLIAEWRRNNGVLPGSVSSPEGVLARRMRNRTITCCNAGPPIR